MVAEARPADLALLARLEEYAAGSGINHADVVGACPDHLVMECFVKVEAVQSMDFARFDSQMARLMACLGRSYVGDDAIGGMEPAQYWTQMVSCCEYFDGDDGVDVYVSDTQPAHWSAWLHHAIDCGMTPESLVARRGEWPDFATGRTEPFRQAIEVRAGVACVAMFDAIVLERAMETRLRSSRCDGPGVLNAAPNARRRGPL